MQARFTYERRAEKDGAEGASRDDHSLRALDLFIWNSGNQGKNSDVPDSKSIPVLHPPHP
jgi:hypothetical protein